jgi:hypothetical protein
VLEQFDVPCGQINNYQQVFQDPHVIHRSMKIDNVYADGTTVSTIASPLRLQGTPPQYDRAPPKLGDSNHEVLVDILGYSEKEVQDLKKKKII